MRSCHTSNRIIFTFVREKVNFCFASISSFMSYLFCDLLKMKWYNKFESKISTLCFSLHSFNDLKLTHSWKRMKFVKKTRWFENYTNVISEIFSRHMTLCHKISKQWFNSVLVNSISLWIDEYKWKFHQYVKHSIVSFSRSDLNDNNFCEWNVVLALNNAARETCLIERSIRCRQKTLLNFHSFYAKFFWIHECWRFVKDHVTRNSIRIAIFSQKNCW